MARIVLLQRHRRGHCVGEHEAEPTEVVRELQSLLKIPVDPIDGFFGSAHIVIAGVREFVFLQVLELVAVEADFEVRQIAVLVDQDVELVAEGLVGLVDDLAVTLLP